MLFKDIREQIVYAAVIAYYWKFDVNSAELACLDHVVAGSLLKLEYSVDVLVISKYNFGNIQQVTNY